MRMLRRLVGMLPCQGDVVASLGALFVVVRCYEQSLSDFASDCLRGQSAARCGLSLIDVRRDMVSLRIAPLNLNP
jgi:hypothetical protein